jgi:hypothetical protein
MQFPRSIRFTSYLAVFTALAFIFAALSSTPLRAQDDESGTAHGRKYKAPPETSHIEVMVVKSYNKKPIDGAHVILHPVMDGKDEGNLEIKTHPDGKAVIDVIPTGSAVRIQVFADGFATFADDYVINEPSRQIVVSMVRPRAQVSAYIDNEGKPIRPKPATSSAGTSGNSPNTPPTAAKPQD